jgi:hypothetical protein
VKATRDKTTYIKLDRNILQWGWFKDDKTFKLWIYLLLSANVTDHVFMGVEIRRGELASSYKSLANATGLSERSVRTAVEHLKSTGELTVNRHPKFSVFSIPLYDYYQSNRQSPRQSTDSRSTDDRQQYKNDKNEIEGKGGVQRRNPAPKMSAYEFAVRKAAELAAAGDDEEDDDE